MSDTGAAPAQVATSMTHDLLGRKKTMTDPDKGTWKYRYNALGELTCQQSAAGHFTVMTYDGLGRMASRKDYRAHGGVNCDALQSAQTPSLEADASWHYDSPANGLGRLSLVTDPESGYRKAHTYDAFGRPDTVVTTPGTGADEHYGKTTYDEYGRTFQVFDASRTSEDYIDHGVRHAYNANGYFKALRDAAGTVDGQGAFTPRAVYRTVTAMDARGNVTGDVLGNGIERSHGFDGQTGRVQSIEAGLITARDRQHLEYDWDALGNLKQRSRNGTARTEDFCYDDLNRLTRFRLTAGPGPQPDLCRATPGEPGAIETVTYDGYGNIRTRSGVAYRYGSDTGVSPLSTAGPHAVASVTKADGARVDYVYDANGNNTSSGDGRSIAYTAFDKPASIAKGNHTTAFAYGPDRSRFMRRDSEDGTLRTTTLYLGNVEKITDANGRTRIRRHIAGVAIETTGPAPGRCSADGATVTRYVLRDHLGSVDVLTDSDGDVFEEVRFGPWGTRRDATTGGDLTEAAAMAFDHCATTRGFTDHEMLDEVGLVHMNGRIYDPRLGRFLQADPYVQFPGNLQNHNRYSYVMNNPLSYTDPSGHFIFALSALIIASQQSMTWYATAALFGSAAFGDALVQGASFEQALRSGILSGISAAAFSGIGNSLGTHFGGSFAAGLNKTGFALKVALHGTVGGITSALGGGKFGHGVRCWRVYGVGYEL